MEQKIIQETFRMGRTLPEKIQNAPVLEKGLELFFNAWMELNTTRSIGMAVGPIPWLAVHEYANWYELDDDQRDALHYHVNEMDSAYFKHTAKKGDD